MEALWNNGALCIREIQEAFPKTGRPAYTTVQTTVYRLEAKNALRRVKKVGNAHIFEALISRRSAHHRLVEDLLNLFGGRTQPVMAQLIESGKLTLEDVQEAEKLLHKLGKKERRRRDEAPCFPWPQSRHLRRRAFPGLTSRARDRVGFDILS